MNIYKMPNGTYELGDWPARKDPNWINWTWLITLYCDFNCPMCIGFKRKIELSPATLLDKFGVDGCVTRFEKLREKINKNVYITMSGGEPTTVKLLPEFCKELTKRNFMIELHTNLSKPEFKRWVDMVDPNNIGQVMATYHSWKLDKQIDERDMYLENFNYGAFNGLTMVCKNIILPSEVDSADKKLKSLEKLIPVGYPILLWGFIRGVPKSTTDFGKAYPYIYTTKQKDLLNSIRKYRRNDQKAYMDGGGFTKGMKCYAGESYLYMSVEGDIFRCYSYRDKSTVIGNFEKTEIKLNGKACVCTRDYCGVPFWSLWYGENPWNYVPGLKKEDCDFCKSKPWVGELPMYPNFVKK